LVCGVTVLTALLDKTGGTQRFAEIIGSNCDPQSAIFVVGLITGFVSVYSSNLGRGVACVSADGAGLMTSWAAATR